MVFGRDWATSPRRYAVAVDRDVRIPLPRGWLESGDPYFFARRGYAHASVTAETVPAAKIARQKADPS